MTWANRLRLMGGALAVFVLVSVCTIIFTQREGLITSQSASFEAIPYSVGSDYAGTVMQQFVPEGSAVTAGDALVSIQSPTALNALKSPSGVPDSASYTVTDDGTVTLIATQSGIVSEIEAQVGGYVVAGQPLAIIEREASTHVVANFVIDAHNFSRLKEGARVEIVLPGHERIEAAVSKVDVETLEGAANVELEITSDEFIAGSHDGLVSTGTPVTAFVHLNEEGPFSGVREAMLSLAEQVGL